ILDNASFETDWSGFKNWSGMLPSPSAGLFSVTRSQDVAFDGTWSVKSTFAPNTADAAVQVNYAFSDQLDIFVKGNFYLSGAIPNNHHKWIRFKPAGFGPTQGGLYLDSMSGGVTWGDVATVPSNIALHPGIGTPTLNTWHAIEVEYDRRAWNGPHGPRVR